MRLCAYWDCREEVSEGVSFCREHGRRLNRQLIDKCPKCGRYKDTRIKFCPDCTYGRPVAEWKISNRNLDKVTKYIDPTFPIEPVKKSEFSIRQPDIDKGEPVCPGCGSSNLTYKTAFDYYRCEDCEITFVTPVYNYGKTDSSHSGNRDFHSESQVAQPPVRREPATKRREQPTVRREQIYQEDMPERRNEPVRQHNPKPVYMGNDLNLNLMRRHQVDDGTLNTKTLKAKKGGKLGWIYLLVVLCVVGLAALIGWVFMNEQISRVLKDLFQS
jgi:hypothetical protein